MRGSHDRQGMDGMDGPAVPRLGLFGDRWALKEYPVIFYCRVLKAVK